MPQNIELNDNGDRVALKLIKFIEATDDLPLPEELSEREQKTQTTFNILNNTRAGTGVVQVEIINNKKKVELTSAPPSNLNAEEGSNEANAKLDDSTLLSCCSGYEHCKLKCIADPNKHSCPVCKKGVHPICGVVNPEFESEKVGFRYSKICMKCHIATN